MKRVYQYTLKHTQARTQYVSIPEEDFAAITAQLMQTLARISELDAERDEEWRLVRDQYFHRRRRDLPRGQHGENTPTSFIGGLVTNTVYGSQRDLTTRQLEGLENVTAQINQLWEDLPAMTFRQSLFMES